MKKLVAISMAILILLPFTPAKAARVEHEVVPLQVEFSQAELEQMLAPIALYPDTLLSHILIAATYPLEIIQAERWSSRNPDLSADEINRAIAEQDWDPSVKALVPFPKVLQRMSDEIEWTQNLGDAFLQDEARVLAGIQSLRLEAENAGNLENLEHLNVSREEQTIIIEPARREVVYVPYYDPRIVYGNWRWAHYPPVYWNYPGYVNYPSHYYPNSLFFWGPRIHISFGFGFSAFNWHNRHIVVLPHHHHHRYYSRRQIVRHRSHSRWEHNPRHRRGASYRTTAVSSRYNSNRISRNDTRVARIDSRRNASGKLNQRRPETRHQRISDNIRQQTRVREPQLGVGRKPQLGVGKKPQLRGAREANRLGKKDTKQYLQSNRSGSTTKRPSVLRNQTRLDGRKEPTLRNQNRTGKTPTRNAQKFRTESNQRKQISRPKTVTPSVKREYQQPKAEYRQPKAQTQYRAPKQSTPSYKEPKRNSSKSSSERRSSSKSRGSSRERRR